MRALVADGVTVGQLVDEIVAGAASTERDMCVEFLREIAESLPEQNLFTDKIAVKVVDLILDLADAIEGGEHTDAPDETETDERGTLQ